MRQYRDIPSSPKCLIQCEPPPPLDSFRESPPTNRTFAALGPWPVNTQPLPTPILGVTLGPSSHAIVYQGALRPTECRVPKIITRDLAGVGLSLLHPPAPSGMSLCTGMSPAKFALTGHLRGSQVPHVESLIEASHTRSGALDLLHIAETADRAPDRRRGGRAARWGM